MAIRKMSIVKLEEEIVEQVGYRYILRSALEAAHEEGWQAFTLTFKQLINRMGWLGNDVPWEEIELALGKARCWVKVIEEN